MTALAQSDFAKASPAAPAPAALGVQCPGCGSRALAVLQTRRARDGRVLRRRRCRRCGARITTSEHRLR